MRPSSLTSDKLSSLVAAAAEALHRIIRRNAAEHIVRDDLKVLAERRSHQHRQEDDEGHHWRRLRQALYLANGEHPVHTDDIVAPAEVYSAANNASELVPARKQRTRHPKQRKSKRSKR
jgi:hypothetical protein